MSIVYSTLCSVLQINNPNECVQPHVQPHQHSPFLEARVNARSKRESNKKGSKLDKEGSMMISKMEKKKFVQKFGNRMIGKK